MKISVKGTGIMADFTKALGAEVKGRFVHIPHGKGKGYLTGFSWGNDMSVMIRNYYLKEEVLIDWDKSISQDQEFVLFLLSGIFPSLLHPEAPIVTEQASVLICRQLVSTVFAMPSNTQFGSVTIRVSRARLQQLFGHIHHPLIKSVLEARDNFALETGITSHIMQAGNEFIEHIVPEIMESPYYRLKSEELLCYIFGMLMDREAAPMSAMHIDDIKAIYSLKAHLQAHLDEPPNISAQAKHAGMSEPKLRKLFKQTFGKGIFEYYQSLRMQKAAQLLSEKHLTVSEVGYQLGFTNLSHFSRVFEQHLGVKPKKYSTQRAADTAT
jgi:AraC-like DNA-binding protein